MNIEKKLILCSILAISIGIATIVPLAYFMNSEDGTIYAKAETLDKPWFNINVPYAYFKQNSTSTTYCTTDTVAIESTVNADVISQSTDARVEYFEFRFYTDQGLSITNDSYALSVNSSAVSDPLMAFEFSRENWFNSTAGGSGVCVTNLTATRPLERVGTAEVCSLGDSASFNARFGDLIDQIEGSNTIYLDVLRIGYVTFYGNNTTVTLADNQLIQHFEMTRKGDAFTCGEVPTADRLYPGAYPFPTPNY
ncbi:MAG: hypothetical protein ACQCN6_02865 [Candidatus Bathyarchaeia archaeon]|jgi:hypothetical protein